MPVKKQLGRTRRAKKNLALKLVLEQRFKPEISAYFNKIIKNFMAFYITTGSALRSDSYSDDTVALLKKQYIRVSRQFSREMREEGSRLIDIPKALTKQNEDEIDAELSAIITAALGIFIGRESKNRGALIDGTTQNNINAAIQQAQQQLADKQELQTNLAVGILAAAILKRKFKSRQNTIVATETQFIAESTKLIEVVVVANNGAVNINDVVQGTIITVIVARKQWASILDNRVRAHHAAVDGQRRMLQEPFIVMGERLQRPGDPNGSPSNIIGCRCSALYGLL